MKNTRKLTLMQVFFLYQVSYLKDYWVEINEQTLDNEIKMTAENVINDLDGLKYQIITNNEDGEKAPDMLKAIGKEISTFFEKSNNFFEKNTPLAVCEPLIQLKVCEMHQIADQLLEQQKEEEATKAESIITEGDER